MYFFYNYDARGSVKSIISPDRSLFKGYEYDEFGQTKETGDSLFKNDVKFTGAVHDQSANLYYMNARFYNPSTGRFLTQDTYSGSVYAPWTQHLYVYTGNNPVNYVDPTGHVGQYAMADGGGNNPNPPKIKIEESKPKAKKKSYFAKTANQLVFGNYTDDVTLLGTTGQVGLGLIGADLPCDIRDIFYDVTHWEWSFRHVGQTIIDGIGVLPLVGSIKYADEVGTLLKNSDEAASALKGTSKTGFKTQELLDSHFEKHAAEFGNITKQQYLKGAQDLVSSKPGGNILTKVRPNGDTIFYNKATNEFAVKTSDGIIRTYFKPTDGINYFNRQ